MSHDDLPVFGPTEVFGDEGYTPELVVRVAYKLSREQALTALSIGFTDLVPDVDAETITVEETRTELEGWLAAQSIIELDRHVIQARATTYPAEAQTVMDALARALDRAYPPRRPEPVRQPPRYGNGTVTLDTFDHGDVTVPEPTWCAGHEWQPNPHRADITHNGVHVKTSASTWNHGLVEVMDAYISHAPYGELHDEPHPLLALALDVQMDATPEDGRKIAQALRVAALRVDRAADEAERLRDGGTA